MHLLGCRAVILQQGRWDPKAARNIFKPCCCVFSLIQSLEADARKAPPAVGCAGTRRLCEHNLESPMPGEVADSFKSKGLLLLL